MEIGSRSRLIPWLVKYHIDTIIIWTIIIFIFIKMRFFFTLMFLTFIFSYISNSVVEFLMKWIPSRKRLTIEIFLLLIGLFSLIGVFVIPSIIKEIKAVVPKTKKLDEEVEKTLRNTFSDEFVNEIIGKKDANQEQKPVEKILNILGLEISEARQILFKTTSVIFVGVFHFIISIIFSFIFVFDLENIKSRLNKLKESRGRDIYNIVAPNLADFGSILGKAFQAQTIIAILNTILTYIGLTILGIPNKFFLSLIVFLCSFIPILGSFISSVPICLFALEVGGFIRVIQAILFIVLIHTIEAYILNPNIYSAKLKLHPLLTLSVLFICEHFFGLWGLILGLPIAAYIIHYIIFSQEKDSRTTIFMRDSEDKKEEEKKQN